MTDPAGPQESAEGMVDREAMVRTRIRGREKDGLGGAVAHGLGIALQALAEGRREGDQAILAELPLADDQDTRLQIHRVDAQTDRLAHPQAAAIEDVEERGQDEMPPR
jgi:hypothetical protein